MNICVKLCDYYSKLSSSSSTLTILQLPCSDLPSEKNMHSVLKIAGS